MSVQQTLKNLSAFTWSTIAGTVQLGSVIREDGLTAMNMAYAAATEKDLSITIYPSQTIEKEYGADFSWAVKASPPAYLAQAKKLDPLAAQYTGLKEAQTSTLIAAAANLALLYKMDVTPVYVFYNYVIGSDLSPEDWGCTYAAAQAVQDIVGQRTTVSFDVLSLVQKPWYTMFPAGDNGDEPKVTIAKCPPEPSPSSEMQQLLIQQSVLPTRIIIGRK